MSLLFPYNPVHSLYPGSYLTPPCLGLWPKYLPRVQFFQPGPCLPARPHPGSPPICRPSPRELTPAHMDTHGRPLPPCASPHAPSPAPSRRPPPACASTCHLPPCSRPGGPTRWSAHSPQPAAGRFDLLRPGPATLKTQR